MKVDRRFWNSVNKSSAGGCWNWMLCTDRHGYGKVNRNGVTMIAHRYAYELHTGKNIKGHLLCHTCDNPKCCNPDHMFLGTHLDNVQDMKRKGRAAKGRDTRTKLDRGKVRMIRDNPLEMTTAELASLFDCTIGSIRHVKNYKTYKNV